MNDVVAVVLSSSSSMLRRSDYITRILHVKLKYITHCGAPLTLILRFAAPQMALHCMQFAASSGCANADSAGSLRSGASHC